MGDGNFLYKDFINNINNNKDYDHDYDYDYDYDYYYYLPLGRPALYQLS